MIYNLLGIWIIACSLMILIAIGLMPVECRGAISIGNMIVAGCVK